MGRFSKLDFDPAKPRRADIAGDEAWPDMDEQACLQSGDEAFESGRYETALVAYSRALRFSRDTVAAWVGQIRCLINLGEYPEAVTWSDRALERFPDSADVLACKGLALVHTRQAAEGMEYLDGAVQMRSPSAWVWLARGTGLLLANRQNTDNARRCFLKAVEFSPGDWRLEMQIGMAYNQAGLHAQARDPLICAERQEHRNPLLLYHLGLMYERLGESAIAAGCYRRALDENPAFPAARDALARAGFSNPLSRAWLRLRAKFGPS